MSLRAWVTMVDGSRAGRHAQPMTNRKDRGQGEGLVKVASVVAAGLGLASTSSQLAAAAGVLGLAGGLAEAGRALYSAFQARQDHRIGLLLEEAYFENASDEGFGDYVVALLQDPRSRRLLLESTRTALEAVCDEALPALAALLREYQRTGLEPDARFRGLCRVLQELSPDEYSSFRALFRCASTDRALVESQGIAFVLAANERAGTTRVAVAGIDPGATLHVVAVDGCDVGLFPRLSHLLYVHHIGEKLGWGAVTLSDETIRDEIRLGPAVVEWVARFLAK